MGAESLWSSHIEKGMGERERIEKAILHRKEVQERAQSMNLKVPDFGIIDEQISKLENKKNNLIQDLHLSADSPAVKELERNIKRLKKERGNGMNRKIETAH